MANQTFDPSAASRPYSQQPQGPQGAGGEVRPGSYGVVSNTGKGVAPRRHKLHRNNVEQEENEMMTERRLTGEFYKYPQLVHKTGGMTREVLNDSELEDALAKGWKENVSDVDDLEPKEAPTRVNHMTLKDALAFIELHSRDAAKLVEIRHDEQTNGNRKAVLEALAQAEDAFGFPGMNVKQAKPVKQAKK